MDRIIGRRIDGRYEITELIGVGGMSNVYRAVDVLDGKIVAVKILREEFQSNEEFLRRFKNESKAISVLSHPNIIKVYDVSFSERMPAIVMEYVDGVTLKEYIEQQGVLSWKEAIYFAVQILRALQHAHDKGIVHRDVKPQNVMLLSDGSLKIADFGIARFSRSETRTLTDRAIGSVHYIAPEQARGEHTDARADLYGVGVMLFEMLTGKLPFEADSPVSVALKQIQLEAVRPTSINPDIPEGLEEIIMKAMQKDIVRRYQSAAEMLKDIDLFKNDPTMHFEYQYLSPDSETESRKYRRAISASRENKRGGGQTSGNRERKDLRKPTGRAARPPRQNDDQHESVIPALAGVTAAFVLVALAFIATMVWLNNPFARVADVKVPNLVGVMYDAVKNSPEYKDFVIEVESTDFSATYDKGVIFNQSPVAGRTVKVGSKIKVSVSGGQKLVTLPNLIGQEMEVVYAQLTQLGLEYTVAEVFSDSQPAGRLAAMEPGSGSQVAEKSTVKLQISMGPESKVVEVPQLVGLSLEDAKKLAAAFGLEIGGITYVDGEEAYNTVVAQDPASTSLLAEGGMINVNVSSGGLGLKQVKITIPMPKRIDWLVKVQAVIDGKVVLEETVQPNYVRYWYPIFEGNGTVSAIILVDGQLYQEYEINFEDESYKRISDFSGNF
jgi:serine/threonine-protein kinase